MRYPILNFIAVAAFVLIAACSTDDPDTPPVNASFQGEFLNAVHQTSGTASVDSSGTTLTLTNFKTDSGPDLNIYLASNLNNITADYIDLGDIKGIDGTYTYDILGGTDFFDYKFVVVWCVDFDVNFGYAILAEQ